MHNSRRFRLPALAFLGCLFAAPLLVIVYHAILAIEYDIHRTQTEIRGVRMHVVLVELLEDIGNYSGRVSAMSMNAFDKRSILDAARDDLAKVIKEADDLNRDIGEEVGTAKDWPRSGRRP